MTTPPQILPASTPAGQPRQAGLPGPAWPPVTVAVEDVFSDVFSDVFGLLVITTTIQTLP